MIHPLSSIANVYNYTRSPMKWGSILIQRRHADNGSITHWKVVFATNFVSKIKNDRVTMLIDSGAEILVIGTTFACKV